MHQKDSALDPRTLQSLIDQALSSGARLRNPVSLVWLLFTLFWIAFGILLHWVGGFAAPVCAVFFTKSLLDSIWLSGNDRFIVFLNQDGSIWRVDRTTRQLFTRAKLARHMQVVFDLTPGQTRAFSLETTRDVEELEINRQRLTFDWQIDCHTLTPNDARTVVEWLLRGFREATNDPWWHTVDQIKFIQNLPPGLTLKSPPKLVTDYPYSVTDP
jgi:hypothetical protein